MPTACADARPGQFPSDRGRAPWPDRYEARRCARARRGQRGCGDQHRCQEKEREGVLQAAGQEQEPGQLDDVERQQRRRIERLQPLHRVEDGLHREIDHRRKADDHEAGEDRELEIQSLRDDEDGGELPQNGQPPQSQDGVEADIAVRLAKFGRHYVGHGRSLAVRRHDHKSARRSQSLAPAIPMAQ